MLPEYALVLITLVIVAVPSLPFICCVAWIGSRIVMCWHRREAEFYRYIVRDELARARMANSELLDAKPLYSD